MAKSEVSSAELRRALMDLVPLEKKRKLRGEIQEWVLGKGATLDAQLGEFEVAFALRKFRTELGDAVDAAKLDGLVQKYGATGLIAVKGIALATGAEKARARRQATRQPTQFDGFMGFTDVAWRGPTED